VTGDVIGAGDVFGVSAGSLDDVLTGLPAPKITFQFDAGDPWIGSQAVSLAPVPAWSWPDDLAGLLWIENRLPFGLVTRPNQDSRLAMPPALRPSP
jgi:hypothetical protein